MKLMHLSDLHLGKRVNEYSMLDDQRYILEQILAIADEEKPDCLLIAGDVYDKSVAPAEAVELLDSFLVALSQRKIPVLIISGNHDSPERLAFGGKLMRASGIYLSPVYDGQIAPITLSDCHGSVNFYLLPFVKPTHVRRFFPEAQIDSYTDALRVAIENMRIDPQARNVLLTHQFVTGAEKCDSEELSVGGSDNVDAAVFADFDYVALGHLHGPQSIAPHIRYCGTMLKYSFSEAGHKKSVTVVQLEEKGQLLVRTIPLVPQRDMVQIKGSFQQLTARGYYEGTALQEDYVHITLTDEEDIPDAIGRLRSIYKHLMRLDYDNKRTRSNAQLGSIADMDRKSELELFAEFYEKQNNTPLSNQQRGYLEDLIGKLKEEEQ